MYQRSWQALLISAIFCTGAIMEPLKRLIGGFVVASAAIVAALVAGHPALAAATLTASPVDGPSGSPSTGTFDGTSTGTSDGTQDGTSGCASPCDASTPTLQLSQSQAAPGDTISVTGDGYAQCTDPESQDTSVRLLGDGNQIADVTGSGGSFSTQITVPPNEPAGDHTVAAECFDAASGETTSGVLASSDLVVTEPGGGGGSPPAQGNGSNSGQGVNGSNSGQGNGSGQGDISGQGNGSPGQSSTGDGAPIALVSGVGGGLIVAILLLLWALVSHTGKRRRGVRWVKEHLRAVPESSPGAPSAAIRPRPGAKSVSLGLEPHADHLGSQKIKEVAR
jgi:hypothetical protein